MTYEQKGAWVYLVCVVVTYTAYVVVLLGRADGGPLTDVAYVPLLLGSIGVSIVAAIVLRIVVEIVAPSRRLKADERDRDIDRRGEYVGGAVLAVAMIVPFALALLDEDTFWIANAIYAAFALSAVVGTTVKLVTYRRGM